MCLHMHAYIDTHSASDICTTIHTGSDALCVHTKVWDLTVDVPGRVGEYLLLTAPFVLKSKVCLHWCVCIAMLHFRCVLPLPRWLARSFQL